MEINQQPITIERVIKAPMEKVWSDWTEPEHIEHWAYAADDWEASDAENDLRAGGRFKTHMGAKDGSAGFDFGGTYTAVEDHKLIEYDLDDGRHVKTVFVETPEGVKVTQTFDPEQENPVEKQRAGWQAILDNFKRYAEAEV